MMPGLELTTGLGVEVRGDTFWVEVRVQIRDRVLKGTYRIRSPGNDWWFGSKHELVCVCFIIKAGCR